MEHKRCLLQLTNAVPTINSSNTGLWFQSWSVDRNTATSLQRGTLLEYTSKLVWSKQRTTLPCCSALGLCVTKTSMPHDTSKQQKTVEMKAIFFCFPCSFLPRNTYFVGFLFLCLFLFTYFSSFYLLQIPQLSVWKVVTSLTTCYLLNPNYYRSLGEGGYPTQDFSFLKAIWDSIYE